MQRFVAILMNNASWLPVQESFSNCRVYQIFLTQWTLSLSLSLSLYIYIYIYIYGVWGSVVVKALRY